MEQQQGYGIPYAMRVYNIKRIEICYEAEVNRRLNRGEVLLSISTGSNEHGVEPVFIFGIPWTDYCISEKWWKFHESTLKLWNNYKKEWYCPRCNPLPKWQLVETNHG